MDGWMDGWMDGNDGWMDGRMEWNGMGWMEWNGMDGWMHAWYQDGYTLFFISNAFFEQGKESCKV